MSASPSSDVSVYINRFSKLLKRLENMTDDQYYETDSEGHIIHTHAHARRDQINRVTELLSFLAKLKEFSDITCTGEELKALTPENFKDSMSYRKVNYKMRNMSHVDS